MLTRAEAEAGPVVSEVERLVYAYRVLGEIHLSRHRYEEAADAVGRYLAIHPHDRDALDLRARIARDREKEVSEAPAIPATQHPRPQAQENLFADLATPTLAEIYFDQGQIEEAIRTYEKVLMKDPHDNSSKGRLIQLKELRQRAASPQVPDGRPSRRASEKLIRVLENWRARIKELHNA